jgi:hypothetical protein
MNLRNIKKKLNSEEYKNFIKFKNSWRAMNFNEKGKKIGCEWKSFESFYDDMFSTWVSGMVLSRNDKNKPFSKENCTWILKGDENNHRLIKLEYNNQIKTLVEWCNEFNLNLGGVTSRYHRYKKLPIEQILFGLIKKPRRNPDNNITLLKSRKMVSAYKCKDKKRGWIYDERLTKEWFMENILLKNCTYCGYDKNIGADRIDNNLGHNIDNIVPCCINCNTIRNNIFTQEEMFIIGKFCRNIIDSRS